MNYVTNENGNIATIDFWGSREAAEASLKTLTNCSNCSNCSYCSNCSKCSNCSNCSYCSNCSNCSKQPIANIITPLWSICLRDDYTLKIGCQDHIIEKWLSFTDGQIQVMALEAPVFWKQWKPIIEILYSQRKQNETGH